MPCFLLDMDGVLYHGDVVVSGAREFLDAISAYPHLFITNNSWRSPQEVVNRLKRIGLPVIGTEQVVTSAQVTASVLAAEKPNFRYFAVGGDGLHEALSKHGVVDENHADYVIIGEGPGLDFDSLTLGGNLVLAGAELICTNPDNSVDAIIDGQHRVLPGGGSLIAPFQVMTGHNARVMGKPYAPLYQAGLQRLGCLAENCIMVGDRPDTDIEGAARLGMRSLLVRTGRFPPLAVYPSLLSPPTWDVDNLLDWLRQYPGVLLDS